MGIEDLVKKFSESAAVNTMTEYNVNKCVKPMSDAEFEVELWKMVRGERTGVLYLTSGNVNFI